MPAAKKQTARSRTGRTPKNARAKPKAKRSAAQVKADKARAEKARADAPDWGPAWLAAFERTGMVSAACEEAQVGRRTVYDRRHSDEAFALAWHDVELKTTEVLEREAFRRAAVGVSRPVLYKGEPVMIGEGEDARPLMEREFSDTLLIFLLKARKPETYRENVKVHHGGAVDHRHGVLGDREPMELSKDARDAIAKALLDDAVDPESEVVQAHLARLRDGGTDG